MSEARLAHARACFAAFATGDREAAERLMAPGLRFSSPADLDLDRAGWFERCWPGAGTYVVGHSLVRLVAHEDEVIATYEATKADGARFCNTEVLTFDAEDRIARVEVYFGWDLPA